MPITKCAQCGAGDLFDGRLMAQGGVVLARNNRLSWKFIPVKCTACLTCGAVFPRIDQAEIEKVRVWKAEALRDPQSAAEGSGQGNPAAIVITLILLTLGIVAAIVIPMLNAAGKLK